MANSELWPNRPTTPWWFSYEWGPGAAQVAFGPARATTSLCVTSITVSCAGDQGTYFDLIVGDDEGEALDFVFRVYVPALTSLTFPFPTPLVLRRDQPWVLTVEPLIKDGLFQTMLVGYVSEERPALRPFRDTAGPARETTPVDRRLDELERENMDLREKLAEATRDRPIK